ncbi:MAG: hypothetical protein IKS32_10785, partial [Solobacterium sp.]|nr:hypothetical protein [Solobacterium sp.]
MAVQWKKVSVFLLCAFLFTLCIMPRAYAEEEPESTEEEAGLVTETEEITEEPEEEVIEEEECAEAEEELTEESAGTERTILLYFCGSDLESTLGMASHNLRQILKANFSAQGKIRVIVLTGGSSEWHLEPQYIYGQPAVSNKYNQVWEAFGADCPDKDKRGKLVFLRNGITTGESDDPLPIEKESVSLPQTLKAFINYGVQKAEAKQYDLILWDHGTGAKGGFANDGNVSESEMKVEQILDALRDNDVIRNRGKFDFVDFDTCLMNSAETTLAFADTMKYYIASPEIEPASGQDYQWLNDLGAEPDMNTYALGKKIVDYCIHYYQPDAGVPASQEATLAVIDVERLCSGKFISALINLNQTLRQEAREANSETGDYLFYDEFRSQVGSIRYGKMEYWDLASLAGQIGIAEKEVTLKNLKTDEINTDNRYTGIVQPLTDTLADPDTIYAKGTSGIHTDFVFYRKPGDGELEFDQMKTGGMYIFFPLSSTPGSIVSYAERMKRVSAMMPDNDRRKEFFASYVQTMLDYALIQMTGREVSSMLASGTPKSQIDYASVKNSWKNSEELSEVVQKILEARTEKEDESEEWLKALTVQQRNEALAPENVSSWNVKDRSGTGYQITVSDVRKRVLNSVDIKVTAHLPAAQKYLEEHDDIWKKAMKAGVRADIEIGTINGTQDFDLKPVEPEENYLKEYIRWLNEPVSEWSVEAFGDQWYAVQDSASHLHAAEVLFSKDRCEVPAIYEENGELEQVKLVFSAKDHTLTEISFLQANGYTPVKPEDLKKELVLTTAKAFDLFGVEKHAFPISETSFLLNRENASSLKLIYTEAENISDIRGEDGNPGLTRKAVVKDIYDFEYDITDAVIKKPKGTLTSVHLAEMPAAVYSGTEQIPGVSINGISLKEGTDYTFVKDAGDTLKDAGSYDVLIIGTGNYTHSQLMEFIIRKASIRTASITGISDAEYTGKPITPKPVIQLGDVTLKEGTDYKLSYSNNVNIGTATVTIEGINNLKDSTSVSFRIVEEL